MQRARDFELADELMEQLRALGVAYADDASRSAGPPARAGGREGGLSE